MEKEVETFRYQRYQSKVRKEFKYKLFIHIKNKLLFNLALQYSNILFQSKHIILMASIWSQIDFLTLQRNPFGIKIKPLSLLVSRQSIIV